MNNNNIIRVKINYIKYKLGYISGKTKGVKFNTPQLFEDEIKNYEYIISIKTLNCILDELIQLISILLEKIDANEKTFNVQSIWSIMRLLSFKSNFSNKYITPIQLLLNKLHGGNFIYIQTLMERNSNIINNESEWESELFQL